MPAKTRPHGRNIRTPEDHCVLDHLDHLDRQHPHSLELRKIED